MRQRAEFDDKTAGVIEGKIACAVVRIHNLFYFACGMSFHVFFLFFDLQCYSMTGRRIALPG